MGLLNKNIKIILNWVVGPLLFLFLSWGIVQQLNQQGEWKRFAWQTLLQDRWYFLLGFPILLMLLQWYLEAIKWKLLMRSTQKITDGFAFKSVLGGIALSVVTPNRMGEWVGRALFLPPASRPAGAATVFIGNLAQLCITLVMGEIAVLYILWSGADLSQTGLWNWSWFLLSVVSFFFAVLAIALYFGSPGLIHRLLQWRVLDAYKERWSYLGHLPRGWLFKALSLAFLRYGIFLIQYAWVLYVLADISWKEVLVFIPVFLLMLSIIPTFSIVELGLRWQLGALLIPSAREHLLEVTIGSSWIWFINMIVPACLGALLYLFYRPFSLGKKI